MAGEQTGRREPVFNAPTIVVVLIACLVIVHTVRQSLAYGDDALVVMYMAFIPARLTEVAPAFQVAHWLDTRRRSRTLFCTLIGCI